MWRSRDGSCQPSARHALQRCTCRRSESIQSLLNYLPIEISNKKRNSIGSSAAAGEHQPVADAAVFFQEFRPTSWSELQELGIIKDGAVLCSGGKIVTACRTKDALRDPWIKKESQKDRRDRLRRTSRPARICGLAYPSRICYAAAGGF